MATFKMTAHFHFNPCKVSHLVLVLTFIVISTFSVNGLHNRRNYHNREFNRFEPKKVHSYHHHDGLSKQASSIKDGKLPLNFVSNSVYETHNHDNSLHHSLLKGKLHHEGDALKHRKHHAWFSVINRNKIKSSGSGNVFNQAIAQHKNKIGNVDLDGENDIDSDSEHQRQLRSVISAAALTSAQIGFTKPDECPERSEYAIVEKDGSESVKTKNGKGKKTCQRQCKSDDDCKNERKLCLCDGACGMSCIRPERECPELPDPPNGQVHLTGRHFNDRAVYTCDNTFQIVGVDKVTCNSAGQWNGVQPTCKKATSSTQSRYYCGVPPEMPNAKHNGTKEQTFYDLDTELTYTCVPGYKRIEGFQGAQCFFFNGTARWFGPDLSCQPIDCKRPEEILNGETIGECTTYRCQIQYKCVPGFELTGKDTVYCQSDGTWTPSELPTCIPVQCPIPNGITNGKALYTAVAYKSVVNYECSYGFMVIGDRTRTCGEDKQWSGDTPTCVEINCGSPGNLPNGFLDGGSSTLNAQITFKCHKGMTFEGQSDTTTCQSDGTWSDPLPNCYAPCYVKDIPMGRSLDVELNTNAPHDTTMNISCSENYELASSLPIRCNNGTWTEEPKCEPARCKILPSPPLNGMVVVPETKHGGIGLYQCKDGYKLTGANTTECRYGNWTDTTPKCEEVYCKFPGTIENGKVLLVGNMGLYDYRPYVTKVKTNRQIMFECKKGGILSDGPPGATCIDGEWRPQDLPKCTNGFHPKMEWLSKRSADYDHEPIRIPKRAKRELRRRQIKAKKLEKEARIHESSKETAVTKIELSSRHRRSKGTTHHRDCPPIVDGNLNIEVVKPGKNHATHSRGSSLKVSCKTGYSLNLPKKKIRCRKGNWLPGVPECLPLGCKLPRLPNGEGTFKSDGTILPMDGKKVEHGKEVDLDCDDGYFRNGPARLRCWFGEWSAGSSTGFGMPKCVGNPCELPVIKGEGGKYVSNHGSYRAGQVIPHDALIDYTCSDDEEGQKSPRHLQCKLGRVIPNLPTCSEEEEQNPIKLLATGSGFDGSKASIPYASSPFIVKDGDLQKKQIPDERHTILDLLQSSYQPNLFVKSREKSSCPRPNAVDGSLIYKGAADSPIQNQQSDGSTRFPHGTEVRFDCLRTAVEEVEPISTVGEEPAEDEDYIENVEYEEEVSDYEEDNAEYVEGETEIGAVEYQYRKKRAIRQKTNKRKKQKNRNSNRRRNHPGTLDEDEHDSYGGSNQVAKGEKIEDMLKKEKYRSWTIVCNDGKWIGRSLGCDEHGHPLLDDETSGVDYNPFNASCPYVNNPEDNIVAFHGDREIKASDDKPEGYVDGVTIPYKEYFEPGSELVFRCNDIGKYMIEGSIRRRCIGGKWDGLQPKCIGLNQHHDYSPIMPPTILFRHKNGQIAQTNDGKLVVEPGTTLHMECLYKRRNGTPSWNIRNYSKRTYPQIWTTDPGRNAQLEYRLSIFYARVNDTGSYSCITPNQNRHTVRIVVKKVQCPSIIRTPGLEISDETSTGLNAEVSFSCNNGNSLIGEEQVKCLPSGRWSAPIPACEDVVCTENITLLTKRPNFRLHVHSFAAGGEAEFACGRGHRLVGVKKATCLNNGEWSVALNDNDKSSMKSMVPECMPITCSKPKAPENGGVSANGPLDVGDMVKFHCDSGYMMEGQPIMTCVEIPRETAIDNYGGNDDYYDDGEDPGMEETVGRWNGKIPRCVRACTYPGTAVGGMISDVRFYYKVGSTVSFECTPGLVIKGPTMLECLPSGAWSGSVPECTKTLYEDEIEHKK